MKILNNLKINQFYKFSETPKFYLFICFYIFFSFSITAQDSLKTQEIAVNRLINGTLLLPEAENPPLAIIIAGSGPTDRDGNQPMLKNNSLKKLAEALTANGIATFRYDKRIVALIKSGNVVESEIRFDDFVTDAVSVVDYFKAEGYTNITLIGHSQGALIANLAAEKTEVSNLVLLAGAGKSIDAVIVDQLQAQAPGLKADAEKAFAEIRTKGTTADFNPALNSLLRPSIQAFMGSWMAYDPAEEIKKIKIPVLIVTGSTDLQVSKAEGELLAQANPDARYIHIEGMNHVLKPIAGGSLENSKSYNETTQPVTPQLIEELTRFIKI